MSDKQGAVSVSSSPDMADSEGLEIYQDDIDLYLQEYIDSRGLDRNKIPSTQWAAALMFVNAHTFRRDKSSLLRSNGHTPYEYDLFAVSRLIDRYIYLCMDYNQRVCIAHFCYLSGIDDNTVYNWRSDNRRVFIYNIGSDSSAIDIDLMSSGVVDSSMMDSAKLTICPMDLYKKLIQNTIVSADDLVLSKAGVNSIAYRNAVMERYSSRAAENVQALDVGSIADQLGITGDVALLGDSSK